MFSRLKSLFRDPEPVIDGFFSALSPFHDIGPNPASKPSKAALSANQGFSMDAEALFNDLLNVKVDIEIAKIRMKERAHEQEPTNAETAG